jgi:hypothetical protein
MTLPFALFWEDAQRQWDVYRWIKVWLRLSCDASNVAFCIILSMGYATALLDIGWSLSYAPTSMGVLLLNWSVIRWCAGSAISFFGSWRVLPIINAFVFLGTSNSRIPVDRNAGTVSVFRANVMMVIWLVGMVVLLTARSNRVSRVLVVRL